MPTDSASLLAYLFKASSVPSVKESMKIYNEMISKVEDGKPWLNSLGRFITLNQKFQNIIGKNYSSNIALELTAKEFSSPNDPELLVWYIENFYTSREESVTTIQKLQTFFKKRPTSNQRKEIIEKYNWINAFDDYQLQIIVGEQKSKKSISEFITTHKH